jgi:hypothetical protein
MRLTALCAILACCAGCPGQSLTTCASEPDVTGNWTFTLTPTDGGAPTLPDGMTMTIDAELRQVRSDNALGLGAQLWGTMTSSDKGAFDVIMIPQLMHNNGSKTGAIFGCELKINVPIAMPVHDDDTDQGPLRLALTGNVTARATIAGQLSTLIRQDDKMKLQRSFVWTGVQH